MKVKRSDGKVTRDNVLRCAARIFAEKGFRDARTAEICRVAGANAAAVNYYFGSKEDLYVEAWRHTFEESIVRYPPGGDVSENATPAERLSGQILALVRRIQDPDSLDFDIAHKEMANPTGLLTKVMDKSLTPIRKNLADTVRELLGTRATEEHVELCLMSVESQCFGPLRKMRNGKMSGRQREKWKALREIDSSVMAEHIIDFSLAGIRAIKKKIDAGNN